MDQTADPSVFYLQGAISKLQFNDSLEVTTRSAALSAALFEHADGFRPAERRQIGFRQ